MADDQDSMQGVMLADGETDEDQAQDTGIQHPLAEDGDEDSDDGDEQE
jgi:hypothetical protein